MYKDKNIKKGSVTRSKEGSPGDIIKVIKFIVALMEEIKNENLKFVPDGQEETRNKKRDTQNLEEASDFIKTAQKRVTVILNKNTSSQTTERRGKRTRRETSIENKTTLNKKDAVIKKQKFSGKKHQSASK